jgi:CIC family chloride channel protein
VACAEPLQHPHMRAWLSGWINRSGYLRKWLVLGIAIGSIAGLGAVVFYIALETANQWLLGYLVGYNVPQASGDGGTAGSTGFTRWWAIPLVTFGGVSRMHRWP